MIAVNPLVTAALESDNLKMAHLVDLPGGIFFTDWTVDVVYGGNSYINNGHLLGLSPIKREGGLKTHDHTIKLSGVDQALVDIYESGTLTSQPCIIRRAFFDDAGAIIANEPIILYKGTLDSWASRESGKSANLTLIFTSNWAANRQTAGRRTTLSSQHEVDPADRFFEHAHIEKSNIDWGAK